MFSTPLDIYYCFLYIIAELTSSFCHSLQSVHDATHNNGTTLAATTVEDLQFGVHLRVHRRHILPQRLRHRHQDGGAVQTG